MPETKPTAACRWFAKCEDEATTEIPHSVLGLVPACARCAAWFERMSR
jgi:hypothetical protein